MNNKYYEFSVRVTLKHNNGTFGIKYERLGEFVFCAQSAADARAIAGPSTAGAKRSIDTTRMVEVVGVVSVSREVFPLVHAPLKSLSEAESERRELEYV